jgi:hypothetical protein
MRSLCEISRIADILMRSSNRDSRFFETRSLVSHAVTADFAPSHRNGSSRRASRGLSKVCRFRSKGAPSEFLIFEKAILDSVRPYVRVNLDRIGLSGPCPFTQGSDRIAGIPDRQLRAMCGRLRVGKSFLHVLQHWSVQPCVRPFGAAHMTAGHNALRGSGPDQKRAFLECYGTSGLS